MGHAKFVLSPPGNGLDCHRTWEVLYVGSIPVVISSTLDPLYVGLPVIIVDSWEEVTEDFLERKYIEITNKQHNMDKLYLGYWIDFINQIKQLP